MSPTPPNGTEPEKGILQRVADFFRGQLAAIQSNVSLTRNSLMSQRTSGVGSILAGAPARVATLGLLPILRRPTPTEPPAGEPPAIPLVGPPIEPTVTPAPTGDISQEFSAI